MAHDLSCPTQYLLHPVRTPAFSGVASVHPQVAEARKVLRCEIQQNLDALPILDLCAVDLGFEHWALRVHQEVALSAFDLLAAVVAALFSAYAGRLDRLAIHYPRTGLRVPLEAHPHTLAQGSVHPLPGAIQSPEAEVMVDGLRSEER